MKVVYHPEAESELVQAARFYESRVPGLGIRFLDEIDASITILSHSPETYRIVEGNLRKFTLRKFPFSLYYRIIPGGLRILAVKHASRNPDYWRHRTD
jgi:toxin ParE1/3/4